jgi:hypothetical protein
VAGKTVLWSPIAWARRSEGVNAIAHLKQENEDAKWRCGGRVGLRGGCGTGEHVGWEFFLIGFVEGC